MIPKIATLLCKGISCDCGVRIPYKVFSVMHVCVGVGIRLLPDTRNTSHYNLVLATSLMCFALHLQLPSLFPVFVE